MILNSIRIKIKIIGNSINFFFQFFLYKIYFQIKKIYIRIKLIILGLN